MTRCAKTCREQVQQTAALFDQLVGASEQARWNLDPKLLGGSKIDPEHVLRGLLYRQFTGFCTVYDLVNIDSSVLCHRRDVRSEAYQSTGPDRLVKCVTRR